MTRWITWGYSFRRTSLFIHLYSCQSSFGAGTIRSIRTLGSSKLKRRIISFWKDFSESLLKIQNIEEFIDSKIKKSELLLSEQILSLDEKFEQRLKTFETEQLKSISEEQSRVSENLDSFVQRVDAMKIAYSGTNKTGSGRNSECHCYFTENVSWYNTNLVVLEPSPEQRW